MAQPDIEDVIDAVKTLFSSVFPANLQAVDQRKSNPLSPKPPQVYTFGDVIQTPLLPCMVISSHQSREEVDDDHGWRKQTYTLEIEAYVTGDTIENISRIVRRYGTAIDETLRQNPTLGGLAGVRNVTNISQDYWDTMKNESGMFQVCKVSFDVRLITN